MARILIVDDDPTSRSTLCDAVERLGHDVDEAVDGKKAVASVCRASYHLVMLSLDLPKRSGIRALKSIVEEYPDVPVIATLNAGNAEIAVDGLKNGAKSYLVRPINVDELRIVVEHTLHQSRLNEQNKHLAEEVRRCCGFGGLLGINPKLETALELGLHAAQTDDPVLIFGEPGTGKEHLARAIHYQGKRADGAFVKVDCSASLSGKPGSDLLTCKIEAETVERAHFGTLFVDEAGFLSLDSRVMLEMLVSKRKRPVRIIAATRFTPGTDIADQFLEGLASQPRAISIQLPPLRERIEDIPMLVEHFIGRYRTETGKSVCSIADDAMAYLIDREWKGNVRELANCIERSVIQCDGRCIQSAHLSLNGTAHASNGRKKPPVKSLRDIERDHIKRVLVHCNWNRSSAASMLEIDRKTLRSKIREFGFNPPPGK